MAAAGYDPRAAIDLWDLMSAVEADAAAAGQPISVENRFAFLRTHPTSGVRQRAIEDDLPKAINIWQEYKQNLMTRRSLAAAAASAVQSSDVEEAEASGVVGVATAVSS
jgi:hypothetical protein